MQKLRAQIDTLLVWILVALVALAVLNVLWQVFTRWVLQVPSSYTEELARYLLIWIGLLGSGYAVGKKLHLAIDLLPMKLEGRAAHRLEIAIQALIFLFALSVMVVGGVRLVLLSFRFGQTSAALGMPLGYVYGVVPLTGLLVMFYAAALIDEQRRRLRGEPADETPSQRTTTRAID